MLFSSIQLIDLDVSFEMSVQAVGFLVEFLSEQDVPEEEEEV